MDHLYNNRQQDLYLTFIIFNKYVIKIIFKKYFQNFQCNKLFIVYYLFAWNDYVYPKKTVFNALCCLNFPSHTMQGNVIWVC